MCFMKAHFPPMCKFLLIFQKLAQRLSTWRNPPYVRVLPKTSLQCIAYIPGPLTCCLSQCVSVNDSPQPQDPKERSFLIHCQILHHHPVSQQNLSRGHLLSKCSLNRWICKQMYEPCPRQIPMYACISCIFSSLVYPLIK